jgi:very-short-patch-repair endonuclease
LAAVLACGVGALLTHRSAGALWDVRRWAPARPEVTTSTQRRRPSQALTDLLDRRAPTQSRHAHRFLRLCQRFDLPAPRTQQRVGGRTVDFLWPDARLIVEIDSWDAHGTPTAFQNDRSASNRLQLSGYVVLRFTDSELERDPARVAGLVRRALAAQLTVPPVR